MPPIQNGREGFHVIFLEVALAVLFGGLSALTFSRGGCYSLKKGSGLHFHLECHLLVFGRDTLASITTFWPVQQTLWPPAPAPVLSYTDHPVFHCSFLALQIWTHIGYCSEIQDLTWILQICSAWEDLF